MSSLASSGRILPDWLKSVKFVIDKIHYLHLKYFSLHPLEVFNNRMFR